MFEYSYRVVKSISSGFKIRGVYTDYCICEVKYLDGIPESIDSKEIGISGIDPEELVNDMKKYIDALCLNVLVYNMNTGQFESEEDPILKTGEIEWVIKDQQKDGQAQ